MGAKQSGSSQSTSTVKSGPWEVQAPYLADVFSEAQKNYGTAKNNTYYTGQTVAPFTPAQNTALSNTIGIGNSIDPGVAAASRNNVDTLNGKYLDPNTNPWLKSTFNAAADPVTAQYMTATHPATAGSMASAGRYGSGAYGNAVKQNELGLGRSLDNLATSIYGGNYQNERGNQMTAAGQSAGLNSAQYINPAATLAAGNQQQTQKQNVDTSRMAAYNYNRDQPTNALAGYRSLVDGTFGQSGTTTTAQPIYSNPTSTGLGSLFGLASLATPGAGGTSALGNIFGKSDRRLKTDIRAVGKSFDGQTFYLYRFLGEMEWHVGLMAQEVEKIRPDAVAEIDGVLHVNYVKALEAA